MDIKNIFKKASNDILNDFKKSIGIKEKKNKLYTQNPTTDKEVLQNIWITNNIYINQEDNLLFPTVIKERDRKWGKQIVILVPQGLSSKKIIDKKEIFTTAFDKEIDLDKKGKRIYLKIYKKGLKKTYPYKKEIYENLKGYKLAIPIGYTQTGFKYLDLTKSYHHLLVGGITGLGKSVFLRQGLYSMCKAYSEDYLIIYGIDLKGGIEFKPFINVPNFKQIIISKAETEEILEKLNDVLNKRMSGEKCLPHIILAIDELAEISGNKLSESIIERLSRLSRAYNIHLILCTQRPSADTLDGKIKANLSATVCFRSRNKVNSRILLDNGNAADLPYIPGRCILQTTKEEICQVARLKKDQLYKEYGKGEFESGNENDEDSNMSAGKVIGD
ncbi:MAG: FtsK/SpoIIIE domain-containing protein [bacterium]